MRKFDLHSLICSIYFSTARCRSPRAASLGHCLSALVGPDICSISRSRCFTSSDMAQPSDASCYEWFGTHYILPSSASPLRAGIVVKRVACLYNNDKRVLCALMTVWVILALNSVIASSLVLGVRSGKCAICIPLRMLMDTVGQQ